VKRQNHAMSIKTGEQWPIEEMREKTDILHETNDHREFVRRILAKAKAREGLISEHHHHAVAEIAYELWEKRGHTHGASEMDWFKAEELLKPLGSQNLFFASMEPDLDTPGREI